MDWDRLPGLVEVKEERGETTLVVDGARLVEACEHLRDEHGFNFLSDITATDYLGWRERSQSVAGYYGTPGGRDLNAVGSWGLARLPGERAKRFSLNYHLLALVHGAPRLRVQVWVDDGEPVPSLVDVFPSADWHEREAWDMMGVPVDGHPNLVRILMDDDWQGHPLRKDYPLGGEPVRFSEDE